MEEERPLRKGVILCLVEGKSDQIALGYGLGDFLDRHNETSEVFFLQIKENGEQGGDITSKLGVNPENIERLIVKLFIRPFLEDYGLKPRDIVEIIQFVDMDGAYIDDSKVVEKDVDGPIYTEKGIYTRNPESIRERNKRKRENLNRLCELEDLRVGSLYVPYSIYYFSCNMDHFISGEINLPKEEKMPAARMFARECRNNCQSFLSCFMDCEDARSKRDYYESWEYIKEEAHSIESHSNFYDYLKMFNESI